VPADIAAITGPVTIGRYRLREVLGRGGSSVVYRAINDHRATLPPVVAVKVAIDERCADVGFRADFQAQARVSAVVDHPSVLPVVDHGVDGDRPYLVLPHIQGADLGRRVNAGALTVGRVLALLRQVADGLDAMHRSGVLHLDVKPSNVLVGRVAGAADAADYAGLPTGAAPDRHGEEGAYLTDLGLCRFMADPPGPHSADFVGSPRYASPEHLRGRHVRPSADVYSLACVLFAGLAGRPPYIGDIPAVVTGHLSGLVPSLAALTALPRALDRVVRRGMHPDPASRFASCAELIARARLAIVDGSA